MIPQQYDSEGKSETILSTVNPVLDYDMCCISDELTNKNGQIMRGYSILKKCLLTTYIFFLQFPQKSTC